MSKMNVQEKNLLKVLSLVKTLPITDNSYIFLYNLSKWNKLFKIWFCCCNFVFYAQIFIQIVKGYILCGA